MGSPEHPNWFLDCPLIDDMPVPVTDFAAPTGGFNWNPQGFNPYPDVRYFDILSRDLLDRTDICCLGSFFPLII